MGVLAGEAAGQSTKLVPSRKLFVKINTLESERGMNIVKTKRLRSGSGSGNDQTEERAIGSDKKPLKGKSIQADLVEGAKTTLGLWRIKLSDLQKRKDTLVKQQQNVEPTPEQQGTGKEVKSSQRYSQKKTRRLRLCSGEATAAVRAVETIQKEVDDLTVERNASKDKVDSLEKELARSRESVADVEKEIGETKIQLQAKEKEFVDLKSFYEENNASNLNEEERLKMELNEANADMRLVREEVETLKKRLAEQDERALAAANEQHSEQIQLLQATIAEARDEGTRERGVAESLKQQLDAKVSEVKKTKLEIEQSAEKLEEINSEKEMFMSECEKALESFDREKAKAKELKQKLKDFDQESKANEQMKTEEHEAAATRGDRKSDVPGRRVVQSERGISTSFRKRPAPSWKDLNAKNRNNRRNCTS